MNALERAKEIDKINVVEVPYFAWHLFSSQCKKIDIHCSERISLGEDFDNIEAIRKALDWYVEQFGGKVKWKK